MPIKPQRVESLSSTRRNWSPLTSVIPYCRASRSFEIRVVRAEQIHNVAVFPENAVGKQRELGAEILTRIKPAGGIREDIVIRNDLVEAFHVEPLMNEVACQRL